MNGTLAGKVLASPTVGETGTGRPIAGRTLLVVTRPGPRPPACEFNWHARPADNSQHRVTELTRAAADLIAFVVCARPQVAKPPPVSVLVAPASTVTVAGRAPWPAAATRSDRVTHGRIHCRIARQPIDRESTQTPCEMYRQSQYSASS